MILLRHSESNKAEEDKNSNPDFHSPSQSDCVISRLLRAIKRPIVGTRLIRKPRRSHSPDSSCRRFLDDCYNPQIPPVLFAHIDLYVLGESRILINSSDWDKASQDRDVLKNPSGILPAAHVRFIAFVGYREQDIRGLRCDRWSQRTSFDMQGNRIVAAQTNRSDPDRNLFHLPRVLNCPDRPPLIAAHKLDVSVNDDLRSIDTPEAKVVRVGGLPFAGLMRRVGIPPSDIVPVIDVFAVDDQLGSMYL